MSDKQVSIRVQGLGKCYRVEREGRALLRHLFMRALRKRSSEEFWALRGIDLTVRKGRSLGVIGENGSGKTTLLRLLAGVIEPTEGSIEVLGRVGALLELGAGFHPALTGRENVYLNGSVLGLTRREMDERFDAIAAFAEIGSFMDSPVRNFSSGMLARLGFSVAAHIDPEVLMIDEVLAVGDEKFQRRCLAKVQEFRDAGVTIVFVSHSLRLIRKICDHAIVLNRGSIVASEKPDTAVGAYLARRGDLQGPESRRVLERARASRYGRGGVLIESVRLSDESGSSRAAFAQGECLRVEVDYAAEEPVEDGSLSVVIWSVSEDVVVYGVNTRMDEVPLFRLEKKGRATVVFPGLHLVRGRYEVSVSLNRGYGEVLEQHYRLYNFEVLADRDDVGLVVLEHRWEL